MIVKEALASFTKGFLGAVASISYEKVGPSSMQGGLSDAHVGGKDRWKMILLSVDTGAL